MSAILDAWKAGKGLPDALVIDGHVHIGEWPHAATFHSVEEAVRESAAFMDAHGIDAACAQGGGYMFQVADYSLGNDFLLEVCGRLPGRLIPFACVNPNDRRENILAELGRVHDAGVRCLKLINRYQEDYPGDGPNMMAVYEFAAERGMLVFNHAWKPDVIMEVSARFPETPFIFAHYGNDLDEVLLARPNVHANIWGLGNLGWLDRGLKKVGADKFMLGSDGFLNPMSVGIGPVVFAPLSDEDKRKVLGLNLARLLEKANALPPALKEKYDRELGA